MKKKSFLRISALSLSCLILLVACMGEDKFVIKDRFMQKPKVGVLYAPSAIGKFPDMAKGGPNAKWSVPVPSEFESIAEKIVVSGLKSEWPGAEVSYERSPGNKANYDLLVWVYVKGTYNVMSTGGTANSRLRLSMDSTLSIYDNHAAKNLTSLMGVYLGKVESEEVKINYDSVFTDAISPASLLSSLEKKVSEGVVAYFKEVKEAGGK